MSIEAMKQALEALENHNGNYKLSKAECAEVNKVCDNLRQAIAEAEKQEQGEPVESKKDAVFEASIEFIKTLTGMEPPPIEVAPLEVFQPFKDFTEKVCTIFAASPHPAQSKREPLTDEQIHIRYKAMRDNAPPRYIEIYRDCEAAHRI
jgi:hypothetical protein